MIAVTGSTVSSLAEAADVVLDCGVIEEACPMNLVPTASTTAALAIGHHWPASGSRRLGFAGVLSQCTRRVIGGDVLEVSAISKCHLWHNEISRLVLPTLAANHYFSCMQTNECGGCLGAAGTFEQAP